MTTALVSDAPALATAPASKLPVTLDTKGRVRTSPEQRRLILAELERSGLSAPRFAQRAGMKYSTLAGWLQRSRRTKRRRSQPVRLLEAVVAAPAPAAGLQMHLPGGACLHITEPGQVPLAVALVRALEKSC